VFVVCSCRLARPVLIVLVGATYGLLVLTATQDSAARLPGPVARSVAPVGVGAGGAPGVEVPQLRTRESRSYRQEDGSMVARVWAGAVNFREASGGCRSTMSWWQRRMTG
jgi:hypothetical protein